MNKRGMTLMELLVYMAIVGIVVVVAGTAFTNSTKMRIRTEGKLEASALAENIGSLLRDDIAQMGAKRAYNYTSSGMSDGSFGFNGSVYMSLDPSDPDSSSYALVHLSSDADSLTMKRMSYDSLGNFQRVEEVAWYLKNGVLYRSCKTIENEGVDECPAEDANEVSVAENVSKFKLLPSKPGVESSDYTVSAGKVYPRLLPSNVDTSTHEFKLVARTDADNDFFWVETTPKNGGTSVKIAGFATNYDYENDAINVIGKRANQLYVATAEASTNPWNEQCSKIDSLQAGVEYEISFNVPYSNDDSRSFCPGKDHIAVGFRKKDTGAKITELNDFLFYPPQSSGASTERRFRFSVANTVKDLCMAFTFVMYSPAVNIGTIILENVQLNQVESSNYSFEDGYNPTNALDKRNVKAFKLNLQLQVNNEAGAVSLVVPTPGNGPRD